MEDRAKEQGQCDARWNINKQFLYFIYALIIIIIILIYVITLSSLRWVESKQFQTRALIQSQKSVCPSECK